MPTRRTIAAGALYFVMVFAAGFALGTLRTLLLAPWVDALAATLIELPLILGLSWLACRWVLARQPLPPAAALRIGMGTVFLLLLWSAEILVGLGLMGRNWPAQWAAFSSASGLTGIAAQLAAASFPLLQRSADHSSRRHTDVRGKD